VFGSCRKHPKNFAIKVIRFLVAIYGGGGSARPKSSEENVGEQQERMSRATFSVGFCGVGMVAGAPTVGSSELQEVCSGPPVGALLRPAAISHRRT